MYLYFQNDKVVGYGDLPVEEENGYCIEVSDDDERIVSFNEKMNKKFRIIELKDLLNSTNQWAIEFASGEITSEQFEPIKLQRQSWRDEINKLEGELEE